MVRIRFDKLVRDGVIDGMRAEGSVPEVRQLSSDERIAVGITKLREEQAEMAGATGREALLQEIADQQELLAAMAQELGEDETGMARIRDEKRAKVGGFATWSYVEAVQVADDSEWLPYYRDNPERYPEISE